MDEEVNRANASKRKIQRDLEEMTEAYETLQRECEQLRKQRATSTDKLLRFDDFILLFSVCLFVSYEMLVALSQYFEV